MRRDTKAWGMAGAILVAAGALVAVVLGATSDDLMLAGLDPVEAGQVIAVEAATVRLVAVALAVAAIGFAVLSASQRCLPCDGAAAHLLLITGAGIAVLWSVAASSMAVAAHLATHGHPPGATAAFLTANLIAMAPALLLYATHAGATACVAWRSGQRMVAIVSTVATAGFVVLAALDVAAIGPDGLGVVALPVWALIAGIGLVVHRGAP